MDRAAEGEDIVITRHRRLMARLVPGGPAGHERRLGLLRGHSRVRDGFDQPVPDDILAEFEGER